MKSRRCSKVVSILYIWDKLKLGISCVIHSTCHQTLMSLILFSLPGGFGTWLLSQQHTSLVETECLSIARSACPTESSKTLTGHLWVILWNGTNSRCSNEVIHLMAHESFTNTTTNLVTSVNKQKHISYLLSHILIRRLYSRWSQKQHPSIFFWLTRTNCLTNAISRTCSLSPESSGLICK